ncbi:MAG: NUDIX domain-containing protein [Proteobacteria bacterium]|nr:NUDIX domain-containing protein [Pseudomonadota bacterium]
MSEKPKAPSESAETRWEKWQREGPRPGNRSVDAATVALLRDAQGGLESLMLRRNSKLDFAGGMWVFPGGKVDSGDRSGLEAGDPLAPARRAAVREAREEADIEVAEASLVPFSHWTPPPVAPRQFLTWFFLAPAPDAAVSIDHGEIHDHAWLRPADALARRDRREIELAPPTWVSLNWLRGFERVSDALAAARSREPERFATRIVKLPAGVAALWQGDAGYERGDPDAPGGRHRLYMRDDGWRYERTSAPD